MYVRCCLVEISTKKCIGKCKCGKEIIRCWPTVLWRCEGGRISTVCSRLIPARQWRLGVHNLVQYVCVKYITL